MRPGARVDARTEESFEMVAALFKSPIGLGMLGAVMAMGTAVAGVTVGPSAAHAVSERLNATPAPTEAPTAKPTAAPRPSVSPTATRTSGRTTPTPTAGAARKTPTPALPTAQQV